MHFHAAVKWVKMAATIRSLTTRNGQLHGIVTHRWFCVKLWVGPLPLLLATMCILFAGGGGWPTPCKSNLQVYTNIDVWIWIIWGCWNSFASTYICTPESLFNFFYIGLHRSAYMAQSRWKHDHKGSMHCHSLSLHIGAVELPRVCSHRSANVDMYVLTCGACTWL